MSKTAMLKATESLIIISLCDSFSLSVLHYKINMQMLQNMPSAL